MSLEGKGLTVPYMPFTWEPIIHYWRLFQPIWPGLWCLGYLQWFGLLSWLFSWRWIWRNFGTQPQGSCPKIRHAFSLFLLISSNNENGVCDTLYPNMLIKGKMYKTWNLIKSILFNKIVSKSMWGKDPHLLYYCQIKLLRNISSSRQGRSSLQKNSS